MSEQSNNIGRAFEYICMITLSQEISRFRKTAIDKNSAYHSALRAWNLMDTAFQTISRESAIATVTTLFDMEPMIIEQSDDVLSIKIQNDKEGIEGDVRDIVLTRKEFRWEIGLSIKHNHFAVKHSRLAKKLDFGAKWYGIPCSKKYWESIDPIFMRLEQEKSLGHAWRDLKDKNISIYVPLLNAFMTEIKQSNKTHPDVPQKMVEYLLGEFDFYKIISIDSRRTTKIQSYNLHGQLNHSTRMIKPNIVVPLATLPSRIVSMEFKPNSSNTVELYMDGGWQFSFRIHNAATMVEPSLKFDIQIIGMPATIISIDCKWN